MIVIEALQKMKDEVLNHKSIFIIKFSSTSINSGTSSMSYSSLYSLKLLMLSLCYPCTLYECLFSLLNFFFGGNGVLLYLSHKSMYS